jgi:hypothetical protein
VAQCGQGHEVRENDRFCGQCGQPAFQTTGTPATPAATPQTTSRRNTWLIPAGIAAIGVLAAVGWVIASSGSSSSFATKDDLRQAIVSNGFCNDSDMDDQFFSDNAWYVCEPQAISVYFYAEPPDWEENDRRFRENYDDETLAKDCERLGDLEATGRLISSVRGRNWMVFPSESVTAEDVQSAMGGTISLYRDQLGCP